MNGSLLLAVSDQVWLALISAMASILGPAVLFIMQMKTNARVMQLGDQVEEVHIATNSLTDRLVATTKDEAERRGREEGRMGEVGRKIEAEKEELDKLEKARVTAQEIIARAEEQAMEMLKRAADKGLGS